MQIARTQVSDMKNSLIFEVHGRLDSGAVDDFLEGARQKIQKGIYDLILDCSQLNVITANGMHAILSLTKDLERLGGHLSICGLQGQAKDMFETCAFNELIPTYSNQDEAVARMAA